MTSSTENYKATVEGIMASNGCTPAELNTMLWTKINELVCRGRHLLEDPEIRKLSACSDVLKELYPDLKG